MRMILRILILIFFFVIYISSVEFFLFKHKEWEKWKRKNG